MSSRYLDLLHLADGPAEVLGRQRDRVAAELADVTGKLQEAREQVSALGMRQYELEEALRALDAAIRRLGLTAIANAPSGAPGPSAAPRRA